MWAYAVICCGHFADGAEKFTPEALEDETKAQWYLRQMLGSANFRAGPVMALMSGNLCYQIEHHLYPDLPSNRYARSPSGCRRSARSMSCPTPRARWRANTYWCCAQSSNWLCRTGSWPPPPTTPLRPLPKRNFAASSNDRVKQALETLLHVAADWPRRSATATTGSTDDKCRRGDESLRVLDNGPRQSGLVESREKHFLSQELQGGCDRDGDETD